MREMHIKIVQFHAIGSKLLNLQKEEYSLVVNFMILYCWKQLFPKAVFKSVRLCGTK